MKLVFKTLAGENKEYNDISSLIIEREGSKTIQMKTQNIDNTRSIVIVEGDEV